MVSTRSRSSGGRRTTRSETAASGSIGVTRAPLKRTSRQGTPVRSQPRKTVPSTPNATLGRAGGGSNNSAGPSNPTPVRKTPRRIRSLFGSERPPRPPRRLLPVNANARRNAWNNARGMGPMRRYPIERPSLPPVRRTTGTRVNGTQNNAQNARNRGNGAGPSGTRNRSVCMSESQAEMLLAEARSGVTAIASGRVPPSQQENIARDVARIADALERQSRGCGWRKKILGALVTLLKTVGVGAVVFSYLFPSVAMLMAAKGRGVFEIAKTENRNVRAPTPPHRVLPRLQRSSGTPTNMNAIYKRLLEHGAKTTKFPYFNNYKKI